MLQSVSKNELRRPLGSSSWAGDSASPQVSSGKVVGWLATDTLDLQDVSVAALHLRGNHDDGLR